MAYSWNPCALSGEEPRPTKGVWWSHPSWRSLPISGEPGGSSPLNALDDAADSLVGALSGSPAAWASFQDDDGLGTAASSSASPSLPRGGIVPVPIRDALDLLAPFHAVKGRP